MKDVEHISNCKLKYNNLIFVPYMYCVILWASLQVKSKRYLEKQQAEKVNEKTMLELAWDVEELSKLNETGRQLIVDGKTLLDKSQDPNYDKVADNFGRKLSTFKDQSVAFLKKAVKYKRTPATHALVVRISPEERNKKPYALPVQCLAYESLPDKAVLSIANKVISELAKRGMKVAGTMCVKTENNNCLISFVL